LQAPFGIVGLETAIGLAITELVAPDIISISQMVEKFSTNPRKIIKRPADIREGSEANFTFLDPDLRWKVEVGKFKSKSKNSPFDGKILQGKAVGIFNHGQIFLV